MNAEIYARNNCQYIRVLKYAYMRASQITFYMPARKVPFDRMTVRVRYSNENYFNKNLQYDGSGKMPCLGISVIILMFVTAALQ